MERIRVAKTFSKHHTRRNSYPILNTDGPLRSFTEIAEITGLTVNEVQYLERLAFRKIRAALSAYGYNKEPHT